MRCARNRYLFADSDRCRPFRIKTIFTITFIAEARSDSETTHSRLNLSSQQTLSGSELGKFDANSGVDYCTVRATVPVAVVVPDVPVTVIV